MGTLVDGEGSLRLSGGVVMMVAEGFVRCSEFVILLLWDW